jgi:hypothetical protein
MQFIHIQVCGLQTLKILVIAVWFHKSVPKGFDEGILHFALLDFGTLSTLCYSEQNTILETASGPVVETGISKEINSVCATENINRSKFYTSTRGINSRNPILDPKYV